MEPRDQRGAESSSATVTFSNGLGKESQSNVSPPHGRVISTLQKTGQCDLDAPHQPKSEVVALSHLASSPCLPSPLHFAFSCPLRFKAAAAARHRFNVAQARPYSEHASAHVAISH